MDHKRQALEKIKAKAHALSAYNLRDDVAREIWDIFWLASTGLEEREKAAALDTFTQLSGIPTDSPERSLP